MLGNETTIEWSYDFQMLRLISKEHPSCIICRELTCCIHIYTLELLFDNSNQNIMLCRSERPYLEVKDICPSRECMSGDGFMDYSRFFVRSAIFSKNGGAVNCAERLSPLAGAYLEVEITGSWWFPAFASKVS